MNLRGLKHFIANLGIKHLPFDERASQRRFNKRIARDFLMGGSLIPVYVVLGAWKLVALALLMSTVGPLALALNSLGYFRAGRFLISLSYGVCIAIINVMIGTWTDSEVFCFAGIASVFATFKSDEKVEKAVAIASIAALTVASHFWSIHHAGSIVVPSAWHPYINGAVWFFGGAFLLSQISILLEVMQQQQKDLRESEELYSAIFELAATGLSVLTPEGRYIKVNPEMVRMMGRSEDELQNLRSADITESDDKDLTLSDYKNLVAGRILAVKREKNYIHKSGARVPTLLHARTLRNDDGSVRYFVTSVQDLTEMKATEQKLLQSSKMSSLGEMAGSIAHEINTPLAIIQISAEQLETPEIVEQLTKDEISSMAKTIGDTVLRVATIVKGLKAFARNADQDPMVPISVKTVVEDSLSLCREKFKNAQIELQVEIADELAIDCRPTQISQVLVNLLNNSVDAIEASPERWVKVQARLVGGDAVLRVSDSGRGVPEAIADRILEPFFTTKDVGHGTGLGLSVSKGIIESHGGRFYLDRAAHHTTFIIEIPSVSLSQQAA